MEQKQNNNILDMSIVKKVISEDDITKLYEFRKQLKTLHGLIPKYQKDMGIPTKEEDKYNFFLNKFVDIAKELLGNNDITYEDIDNYLNTCASINVKCFLEENKYGDNINNSIKRLNSMTSDALLFLEHCISLQKNNEYSFEKDELYKEERDFLALFSERDLDNYDKISKIIINESKEENKRKK